LNYNSQAFRSLPPMERVILRSEWQGPCLVYTGPLNTGHGRVAADGKDWQVHRLMWTLLVGPIPDELMLDHLCRNRACWWSDHLEPVTSGVNTLRGHGFSAKHARLTHCKYGHEFTEENTRWDKQSNGRKSLARRCRECGRIKSQKQRDQRKAKV
jgi:hypothetical protein